MPEVFERMRGLYTPCTDIRRKIFVGVTRFVLAGKKPEDIDYLPFDIIDMGKPTYRCCSYRELSIVKQRIRLAFGLPLIEERDNTPVSAGIGEAFTDRKVISAPLVNVIRAACEKCPEDKVIVTDMCQSCMAHPCSIVCPVNAISFPNGGKAFIDQKKCVKCMKCVKACPYQSITRMVRPCAAACGVDAIHSDPDGYATIDQDKCVNCGLCTVSCPFAAISDKTELVQILHQLMGPEDRRPYAILAPSFVGQFGRLASPGAIVAGLRAVGFRGVREVALGADCDTLLLAKRLAEKSSPDNPQHKTFLGTSCCPSWVKTARRHFPEFADNIAESFTPMVETAKIIKDQDPSARVVFIGPCIAKKAEALEPEMQPYVDHVLTFEELAAIFVAKDIDLAEITPVEFPDEASALGRGYAVAGGVATAIAETARQKYGKENIAVARADTLRNCRAMLADIKSGKTSPELVEGMACPGGCVGGPGTLIGLLSARNEVGKFAGLAPKNPATLTK
ncbi:Hydrogenase large subunit domain protein [uncultured spirochete]|uniref:Hydrogenase large subunit domain protein n=1 Tax=uncultured spirochete TaxID=156406 RepID=A0A3P3XK95_9SPIR|nr:monomeric [FeFe] hydrogenase [Rectinema subterraneum]SLM13417.1 Hydrogenase large subunit domain protein [uncultured spirochete]